MRKEIQFYSSLPKQTTTKKYWIVCFENIAYLNNSSLSIKNKNKYKLKQSLFK